MSANDPDDYIRQETDWIKVPLDEGAPFLGLCLGAQMLARHLGAAVTAHPDGSVEVGYYPLWPTEAGRRLMDWPDRVHHFHREGLRPAGRRRAAGGGREIPQPGLLLRSVGLRHPVPYRADQRDGRPLDPADERARQAAGRPGCRGSFRRPRAPRLEDRRASSKPFSTTGWPATGGRRAAEAACRAGLCNLRRNSQIASQRAVTEILILSINCDSNSTRPPADGGGRRGWQGPCHCRATLAFWLCVVSETWRGR